MDQNKWKTLLHEHTLVTEKKDFVATNNKCIITIHNSDDADANERLYDKLTEIIKKWKLKKIDITL